MVEDYIRAREESFRKLWGGVPILNNVRLGLTKMTTLVRFERAEISNTDVKEKKLQTDSVKVLR